MIKIKKQSNKKLLLVLCAVIIIAGLSFLYYRSTNKNNLEKPSSTTGQTQGLNLSPPTAEDAKRAETNKEKNVTRDETINNTPTPEPGKKKSVKPTITYAGLYGDSAEVGGFVSGIFEDGGTCTATFTLSGTTFTKSVTAVKNISTVDCPVMSAPKAQFTQNGKWSVTILYDSSTATGKSDPREIEIK